MIEALLLSCTALAFEVVRWRVVQSMLPAAFAFSRSYWPELVHLALLYVVYVAPVFVRALAESDPSRAVRINPYLRVSIGSPMINHPETNLKRRRHIHDAQISSRYQLVSVI